MNGASDKYFADVIWRWWRGERTNFGIVRLYTSPVAPRDESGMPAQGWVWTCNFILKEEGKVALIEASQIAPPVGAVRPMMQRARDEGCIKLRWQRFEHGIVRTVEFDLLENIAA